MPVACPHGCRLQLEPSRKNVCMPRRLPPAEKTKIEMQNFSELQISNYTKERLAFAKFATPSPVQGAASPPALEGKDVLVAAQAGTGKTLAFLLPIIERLLASKAKGIE